MHQESAIDAIQGQRVRQVLTNRLRAAIKGPSRKYRRVHGKAHLNIFVVEDPKRRHVESRLLSANETAVDYAIYLPVGRSSSIGSARQYLQQLSAGVTMIFSKYEMDVRWARNLARA